MNIATNNTWREQGVHKIAVSYMQYTDIYQVIQVHNGIVYLVQKPGIMKCTTSSYQQKRDHLVLGGYKHRRQTMCKIKIM